MRYLVHRFYVLSACACLATLACGPLSALEEGVTLRQFTFNAGDVTIPEFPTSVLALTVADKPVPLVVMGNPVQGDVVISQPEADTLFKMAEGSEEAAALLDVGSIKGAFSVSFASYAGGHPRAQAAAGELYADKPVWNVRIDKLRDLSYLGHHTGLIPEFFAETYDASTRFIKKENMKKAPKAGANPDGLYVFEAAYEGSLSLRGKTIEVTGDFRIAVARPSNTTEKKPKPIMLAMTELPIDAGQLGLASSQAKLRLFIVGYTDPQEGAAAMDERRPGRVDVGEKEEFEDLDLDL